jgi:hypothetical protein
MRWPADAGVSADSRGDDGHGGPLHADARTNVIFQHSQTMMLVVALIGAFTAIFASDDRHHAKRHQESSGRIRPVSQLGFMFLACGVRRLCDRNLPCNDARPSSRP